LLLLLLVPPSAAVGPLLLPLRLLLLRLRC
jgi:hypothetical protein